MRCMKVVLPEPAMPTQTMATGSLSAMVEGFAGSTEYNEWCEDFFGEVAELFGRYVDCCVCDSWKLSKVQSRDIQRSRNYGALHVEIDISTPLLNPPSHSLKSFTSLPRTDCTVPTWTSNLH